MIGYAAIMPFVLNLAVPPFRRTIPLTLLALSAALSACATGGGNMAVEPRFDLLIIGASVIDGSGGEAFVADVGIRDGRIAEPKLRVGEVVNEWQLETAMEQAVIPPAVGSPIFI